MLIGKNLSSSHAAALLVSKIIILYMTLMSDVVVFSFKVHSEHSAREVNNQGD